MALKYKTRPRLAFLILMVGLPLYVVVAVSLVGLFDRPPIWLEFGIYALLGVLWVFPFKSIFRGVAQPDPAAPPPPAPGEAAPGEAAAETAATETAAAEPSPTEPRRD